MINGAVPTGGEIAVGSTATILDEDIYTEPAVLTDGSFVVIYRGADGEVYQHLYECSGTPMGSEAIVTDGTRSASTPGILSLPDGGYMIYWTQSGTSGSVVQAQMFDASGAADGPLIEPFNTETTMDDLRGTVLANGTTLLTWTEFVSGVGFVAMGQIIKANGALKGGVLTLNENVTYQQTELEVTALSDGGFVVVWEEYSGNTTDKNDIRAQQYDSKGKPVGDVEHINAVTAGDQFDPDVTALVNGGYVVSWWGSYGEDGDNWGTFARMVDASGAAIGQDIQLNTTTYSQQWAPTIEGLPDGGWIAVWQSFDQDGSGEALVGQRFTADGEAFGDEFIINTSTSAAQWYGGVDVAEDGSFVVTWQSHHLGGNTWQVMAQQFAGQLVGTNGDDVLVDAYGADVLYGLDGNDKLKGKSGDDLIDGGADKDKLIGGGGADTLVGGKNKDKLYGGKGSDTLQGGGGKDLLAGELGNDILNGGGSADRFVFEGQVKEGKDTIEDFEVGIDVLEIEGSSQDVLKITDGSELDSTKIKLAGGTVITLLNVTPDEITVDDFLFV